MTDATATNGALVSPIWTSDAPSRSSKTAAPTPRATEEGTSFIADPCISFRGATAPPKKYIKEYAIAALSGMDDHNRDRGD